jgi:hypothetical protein
MCILTRLIRNAYSSLYMSGRRSVSRAVRSSVGTLPQMRRHGLRLVRTKACNQAGEQLVCCARTSRDGMTAPSATMRSESQYVLQFISLGDSWMCKRSYNECVSADAQILLIR